MCVSRWQETLTSFRNVVRRSSVPASVWELRSDVLGAWWLPSCAQPCGGPQMPHTPNAVQGTRVDVSSQGRETRDLGTKPRRTDEKEKRINLN